MPLLKSIHRKMVLQRKLGRSRLILSGGMPRSGSTLLFNILRLALSRDQENRLSSGWIGDIDELAQGDAYLIKLHHINWFTGFRASQIFYTYRDLRDALVSLSRRFEEPTIEVTRSWIRDFRWAQKHADRMIRYEDMMSNLEETVSLLLDDLGIEAPAPEIIAGIPRAHQERIDSGDYSKDTLLHPGHRTNTRPGEWLEVLDADLLDKLHSEFNWWFVQNGYELP